ncbi:MAG: hypothetical protein PHI31_04575 [Desulfuromonadaceae bacterium]|nr:hypothetical protein [Desulfuromonadaceae bacterium]
MKLHFLSRLFVILAISACTVSAVSITAHAVQADGQTNVKKVYTIQGKWKTLDPQRSILKDKNISSNIRTILGSDFKLFTDAIKVVDTTNIAVDSSSYTAYGTSKGLPELRGYISVQKSGEIYIAIITVDSVYYYSNDEYFKTNAPAQVDRWIEKYGLGRNNVSKSK